MKANKILIITPISFKKTINLFFPYSILVLFILLFNVANAGNILIYGPKLVSSTPNEQTLAIAAGHSVTVVTNAQWSAMSTSQFAAYDAIIIPDDGCSTYNGNASLTTLNANKSTWSPAITGKRFYFTADGTLHRQGQYQQLIINGINFVANGGGTGIYYCSSCSWCCTSASAVDFLSLVDNISIQPAGADNVNILQTSHPTMSGISNSGLSNWGSTAHGQFSSFPSTLLNIATVDGVAMIIASPATTPATALNFDGTNDYISINNTLGNFGTGDFTIEMNVKTGLAATYFLSKRVTCNNDNFISMQTANGKLAFEISDGGSGYRAILGSTSINNNAWHHIAVTRKAGTLKLYVDGVLDATSTASFTTNTSNNYTLTLGSSVCNGTSGGNGSLIYNGNMDDIRFWTRAVSECELKQHKSCELIGTQTGLIAHYKFNQGYINQDNTAITTVTDDAGSNTGTLVNFSRTGATSNFVAGTVTGTCGSFTELAFTACPTDIYQNNTNGMCTAVINYTATAVGTPTPAITYVFTGATTGSGSGTGSGSTFNYGTTNVTITATNSCGTTTCTFKVTVSNDFTFDYSFGTLNECEQITIDWHGGCADWNVNLLLVDVTAWTNVEYFATNVSNSGSITYTIPKCLPTGTYLFYIKEASKKTWHYGPNFYVVNTAPALTGTPYSGTTGTNACKANAASAAPFNSTNAIAGYSDRCGGAVTATLTNTDVIGTDCNWKVTYTYTVKDICGTELTDQTYSNTGSDQTAPALTGTAYAGTTGTNACKAGAAAAAPFNSTYAITGYSDNCGAAVTATLTNTDVSGTDCGWRVTFTFTIIDECGNELTGQRYTNSGSDQTAPTLTGTSYSGTTGTNACKAGAAAAAPFNSTDAITGYSDNCGAAVTATLTNTDVSGTDCGWRVTYTFTIIDECGNELTGQRYTNSGSDQTAPALTGTAYAGTTGTNACKAGAAAAAPFNSTDAITGYSDNCGAAVTATLTNTDVSGTDCGWRVTYTFTIIDECGNELTGQKYTNSGSDKTAPKITTHASDRTVECDGSGNSSELAAWLASNGGASASDACSGVTWSDDYTGLSDDCGATGTATVTFTATDGCNNSSTTTASFSIKDTKDPVITCPKDITINCQDDVSPSSTGSASGSDACIGVDITNSDFSSQNSDPTNSGYYNYTITRTWKAEDACGNSSTCDQVITVQDVTKPTAKCKAVTITLENGEASISASDIDDGSDDNCSDVSLSASNTLFDCSNIGTNTVTLTVTDVTGNYSTRDATVTVIGTIPSCTISVTPSDNTYTGGVATHIYLGYGPQSATLKANPTGGSGFAYSWSPSTYLSSATTQSPVFTPTAAGTFTYTVTVTNSNGCTTTCDVTFCVKDIVVSGTSGSGKKVYLCHVPPGNTNNPQTLSISVNAVSSHIENHSGDKLGKCGESCTNNKRTEVAEMVVDIDDLEIICAPNPYTHSFKLIYESNSGLEAKISIYGITGNLIQSATGSGYTDEVELGKDLPAGIYTVSFIQGNKNKVFKVIRID